ncbi:hypothetical protein JTE90_012911 [Oedothorax gibbosus]|uniref:Uncharacterized protein n=1 Tax=Oedothorax gibbosus TaxID=931172 RepID=A0AAV6UGI3_9ARAC|nr:hypothetical protein JTE90_012911 [Oedothorax gibbosus]
MPIPVTCTYGYVESITPLPVTSHPPRPFRLRHIRHVPSGYFTVPTPLPVTSQPLLVEELAPRSSTDAEMSFLRSRITLSYHGRFFDNIRKERT